MNTIELGLSGNIPNLTINIDGEDVFSMDEFKKGFISADVPSFLFNEYMYANSEDDVFNGTMIIGLCACGCQGCDDLIAKITTNSKTTKWTIMQDRDHKIKKIFSFSAKDYANQINYLKDTYFSYSWQTEADKIRRLCTEYIRTFASKDGYNIEGVKIDSVWDNNGEIIKNLSNILEVYYYSDWEPCGEGIGTPYHNWKVKFDGKTLASAMKALEKFSKENLVENKNNVSLRPEPFRLLYTRDKEQMEKYLKK